jgi:hypothetical protein
LVAEWRRSGMSQRAFAEARGIARGTFSWWTWRVGEQRSRAPEFLEVVVEPVEDAVPDLVVEVGAVRVRVPSGFDAHEVRRLVDALC